MRRAASARSTRSRESFAQSLSLDATLEALARSAVELLGVDAAVIRMPDERGELLVPRAPRSGRAARAAVRTILTLPQPLDAPPFGGCSARARRSC